VATKKATSKSSKKVRAVKAAGRAVKRKTKSQRGAPKASQDFFGWLFYSGK
jgi:hypothetical protein